MNKIYVGTLVSVFAGISAMAQMEVPGPAKSGPLMQVIDRNGDGALQQQEIDMAVAALRGLDKDKDGTVSADELKGATENSPRGKRPTERPEQQEPGRQRGRMDLSMLDKDGDGKISREEAPERLKQRFDMIDGNGDGYWDKAEQEQMMKRLHDRSKQPGQGEERGGSASGGELPKRPDPIE